MITGRIDGKTVILGVLADRKKETVKKFLMSIPKKLRKQVRFVCSDMYTGFINAAKEVFGKKIQIIVDRFHVAKWMERVWMSCAKKSWNDSGRAYQKSRIKS